MPSRKFFDILPPDQKRTLKPSKVFLKKKKFSLPFKSLFLPFLFLTVLIVGFHLAVRAEIEIWPRTREVSFETEVLADGKISQPVFSEAAIPALDLIKEKEISQKFTATGVVEKKNKATGQIRVYNNYHLPQILVATTRFISADGKLFRSKETVNIPAGQYLDVLVEAAEPGPEYNIKPSTFSIPGLLGSPRYTAVYGKSFSAMRGGFIGQVSQVKKEDLEKAQTALYEKLIDSLNKELKKSAGDLLLLEGAVQNETVKNECSQQEGNEAKDFECYLKIKSEALIFRQTDLESFAREVISQEIQPTEVIKESSLEVNPVVKKADFVNKEISLGLKIKAEVFSAIDLNLLKEAIKGGSLKESKLLLGGYSEIEKVKIKLFPFWLQKIPQNSKRIEIKLNLD